MLPHCHLHSPFDIHFCPLHHRIKLYKIESSDSSPVFRQSLEKTVQVRVVPCMLSLDLDGHIVAMGINLLTYVIIPDFLRVDCDIYSLVRLGCSLKAQCGRSFYHGFVIVERQSHRDPYQNDGRDDALPRQNPTLVSVK